MKRRNRALHRRYGRALSGEPLGGRRAQRAYPAYRVVTDRVGDEHHIVWHGHDRTKAGQQFEAAVRSGRRTSHGRWHVQIHGQENPTTWLVIRSFDSLHHEVNQ
jgi:hypothetical protein